MKKHIIPILICFACMFGMLAGPVALTGCVAPSAPRAKVYLILIDVYAAKDRAMQAYAIKAVKGQVSKENRKRVWEAVAKFQKAYDAALILVGFDDTKTAPDDVQQLLTELLSITNSL